MSEQDTSTFYDHGEFIDAMKAPEYTTSARYRDELASKLARSRAAGTIGQTGSFHDNRSSISERTVSVETNHGFDGSSVPGKAPPEWAEALKISTGMFDGPEAIARAMAAPHYETDAGYQAAVYEKIQRSIREGFLTHDLRAADPSLRYGGRG